MNASQVVYGSSGFLTDPAKILPYRKLYSKPLLIFSIFNVIAGLVSCILMTAIIVPFSGGFSFSGHGELDVVGHGLWAGLFYIITGFLGYSASYKPTKALVVSTLVFSSVSMVCAVVAITMSAVMGEDVWSTSPCYTYWQTQQYDHYVCETWENLEFVLTGFSALAWAINVVVISLTSVAVCCSGERQNNQSAYYTVPAANYSAGAWNHSNQPFVMQQPPQTAVVPFQAFQQAPRQQVAQQVQQPDERHRPLLSIPPVSNRY